MRLFRNVLFSFLNKYRSNLAEEFKIDAYSFLAQYFWDDFGQFDTKLHWFMFLFVMLLFGQAPLRNSITMATYEVPSDLKLFERVCSMVIQKVTKFQLPTPDGS